MGAVRVCVFYAGMVLGLPISVLEDLKALPTLGAKQHFDPIAGADVG
eukprot:CAMPEP_0180804956 /NCGR_PEP_ID=MMETSP1038_2-20121128/61744_1 /TAXON_ID=632150 /ORGANISM="Azadinium spinosum, Strain 3D9" /LENGTH=46 /DNA_ID= /DNA_START= /DNA_END= /DNA_ORIENTATION=